MRLLFAFSLSLGSLAAHNLDEYLQAALLGVERERVEISVRMTPGPAVFEAFASMLDRDSDGQISDAEQAQYRSRAGRDWRLFLDGAALAMDCQESEISPIPELREGSGSVRMRCIAEMRGLGGGPHRLSFRNDHQPAWSVYMMNALQPGPGVTIQAQKRDSIQREITIEFETHGPARQAGSWWLGAFAAPLFLRAIYLTLSGSRRK